MLGFEFFDSFEFRDPKSSVFTLPLVISWLANAMLAADIAHFHACIGYFQDGDNLSLTVFASFHFASI